MRMSAVWVRFDLIYQDLAPYKYCNYYYYYDHTYTPVTIVPVLKSPLHSHKSGTAQSCPISACSIALLTCCADSDTDPRVFRCAVLASVRWSVATWDCCTRTSHCSSLSTSLSSRTLCTRWRSVFVNEVNDLNGGTHLWRGGNFGHEGGEDISFIQGKCRSLSPGESQFWQSH